MGKKTDEKIIKLLNQLKNMKKLKKNKRKKKSKKSKTPHLLNEHAKQQMVHAAQNAFSGVRGVGGPNHSVLDFHNLKDDVNNIKQQSIQDDARQQQRIMSLEHLIHEAHHRNKEHSMKQLQYQPPQNFDDIPFIEIEELAEVQDLQRKLAEAEAALRVAQIQKANAIEEEDGQKLQDAIDDETKIQTDIAKTQIKVKQYKMSEEARLKQRAYRARKRAEEDASNAGEEDDASAVAVPAAAAKASSSAASSSARPSRTAAAAKPVVPLTTTRASLRGTTKGQ
jgi:hypothetical protein